MSTSNLAKKLGIFLPILLAACDSHTPFASGRAQKIEPPAGIAAKIEPPKTTPPATPSSPGGSSAPVTPPVTTTDHTSSQPRGIGGIEVGAPVAQLYTFPYVTDQQTIPVIFPTLADQGAASLTKVENSLVFGGPFKGKFPIPSDVPKEDEVTLQDRKSGDQVSINVQPTSVESPLVAAVEGTYSRKGKTQKFYAIVPKQQDTKKDIECSCRETWSDLADQNWTNAFLFTPNFREYQKPYKTASLKIKEENDQKILELQRTPDPKGPWVRANLGECRAEAKSVRSVSRQTGKVTRVFPSHLDDHFLMVGIIEDEAKQDTTWFIASPRF